MGYEAERLRFHAKECRELARAARDEAARQELLTIADELETEADRIDAEEPDPEPPMPMPPTMQ
jgi:hypothetical protein